MAVPTVIANNVNSVPIEEHEALKQEFMDFVYTVSHDLNAPLRHTREFAKILVNKLGDRVTDDEREYVHFMEAGIVKAEALLAGLLELSRINSRGKAFAPTDCNLILAEVKETLMTEITESRAVISSNPFPIIMADRDQITSLIYHLLDNAIKFRRTNIEPKINIFTAIDNDGNVEFSIEDNGIGIADEYQDKIFTIFTRLSPNDSVPGIGIGLNLVQEIVTRHGGSLRIESAPGEGTKVCFNITKSN